VTPDDLRRFAVKGTVSASLQVFIDEVCLCVPNKTQALEGIFSLMKRLFITSPGMEPPMAEKRLIALFNRMLPQLRMTTSKGAHTKGQLSAFLDALKAEAAWLSGKLTNLAASGIDTSSPLEN
jgi:hypothetical protein